MSCKFCGESDPLKLMMSTRIINDEVVTIDVCFDCYYREKFEAEANGNSLQSEEGIFEEPEFYESVRRVLQRGDK